MKRIIVLFVWLTLLFSGCASIRTNYEFYFPILTEIQNGNFNSAAEKINEAELNDEYGDKDRVLLHLDKGIIFHYQGNYQESNKEFELAESAIEELYTKSISKGVFSFLLNDNALAYDGEVYEDLYINIFKSLNYLHLNNFDGAYVEVRRITNKLSVLDVKLEEQVAQLNSSDDSKFKVDPVLLNYYNNVLSNYLSYLIFRAEGEYDNSRISYEQLNEAWETYPDVYNFDKPKAVTDSNNNNAIYLNVLSFTGKSPIKEPVGARITTFNDFVTISDPTNFYADAIPIPGIKYGWNFKFEFPQIISSNSEVTSIEVFVDSSKVGELQLLENMNNVAEKTFESQKSIIYFKTITRALIKGIGASALGRTIKKETDDGILGDILVGIANAAVDATEGADLRSWRTMPGFCYVGEFKITEGTYDIEIRFLNQFNQPILSTYYDDYIIKSGLNLLEAYHFN
ncbi:MAG: hypothetical protein H6612_00620 [Ignavibacteriales bacterium]|nr:hypothetical protein [Ignavibacteriales bacterium]MCB9257827.1 hypothetical protein [Ignavibacteriales bacterium]